MKRGVLVGLVVIAIAVGFFLWRDQRCAYADVYWDPSGVGDLSSVGLVLDVRSHDSMALPEHQCGSLETVEVLAVRMAVSEVTFPASVAPVAEVSENDTVVLAFATSGAPTGDYTVFISPLGGATDGMAQRWGTPFQAVYTFGAQGEPGYGVGPEFVADRLLLPGEGDIDTVDALVEVALDLALAGWSDDVSAWFRATGERTTAFRLESGVLSPEEELAAQQQREFDWFADTDPAERALPQMEVDIVPGSGELLGIDWRPARVNLYPDASAQTEFAFVGVRHVGVGFFVLQSDADDERFGIELLYYGPGGRVEVVGGDTRTGPFTVLGVVELDDRGEAVACVSAVGVEPSRIGGCRG